MKIKDLVGVYKFSGFDRTSINNAEIVTITLNDNNYSFIENPEDGYRSLLNKILVNEFTVKNKFEYQKILCVTEEFNDELLIGYDLNTSKIVFKIGTDYADNLYPMFVSKFYPENMFINKK
jgi:hypothetical protein